jgi:hypothetical protein
LETNDWDNWDHVQSSSSGCLARGCDCVLQIFAIQLQPEDIIIAGTDGLFDNVFPEESAALMRYRVTESMVSSPGISSSIAIALAAHNRAA